MESCYAPDPVGVHDPSGGGPSQELAHTSDLVPRKTRIAVFVDFCDGHRYPDHHTREAANSALASRRHASPSGRLS